MGEAELRRRAAALLASDGETVAAALRRYGAVLARDRGVAARRRKKGGGGGEVGGGGGAASARAALDGLTDLADALLMGGAGEVFGATRAELLEGANGATGRDAKRPRRVYFAGDGEGREGGGPPPPQALAEAAPAPMWEYRGNQDGQIHGPYTTEQMVGWIGAGFFVGEAAVDVRRARTASAAATATATADDLMADLMDSDDDDGGCGGGGGGDDEKEEVMREEPWQRSDRVDFRSLLPS